MQVWTVTDITEILRDIARGKINRVGDHWSPSYCNEAADVIEQLRADNLKLEEEIQCMCDDAAGEDI